MNSHKILVMALTVATATARATVIFLKNVHTFPNILNHAISWNIKNVLSSIAIFLKKW